MEKDEEEGLDPPTRIVNFYDDLNKETMSWNIITHTNVSKTFEYCCEGQSQ